ncbi:hypothetical protein GH714_015692 [Hevea brasiliensis]|uniref:ABC transporter domain-containing protein n=1 Tax=Hevea brasiliensis TaxID=3981 RepID=A0A6A6LIG5_HEVBR|nr:hypothetical protein GH714_015692 [Hevea brasiliensis]
MAAALAADDLARVSSRQMSRRSWGSMNVREIWDARDVFQKRARHTMDDDEEELRWAAIERLPTYDRVRKGILKQVLSNGRVVQNEVDVTQLGSQDKKQLMESILQVGIEIPKIEMRFENLLVEGDAIVGTRALPTLLNSTLNAGVLRIFRLSQSKKRVVKILREVNGIVKPSGIALLLGPPGSGKTTLLKALAGKLDDDLRVSGKVTFCGHEFSEFVPQRTCAYISQHDLHCGKMTVRETLDFLGRCSGVGTRYEMLLELSRREKEAGIKPDPEIEAFMKAAAVAGQETSLVTGYVLKLLGLDVCADIMVGDDMRRGISGGQKKRVTTGEMLVGLTKAFFMELDSSTTYQIIKFMRQMVHIMDTKVPRENVLEFFECMGFKCPERKEVADFPHEIAEDLSIPFDKSRTHPAALVTEKYGISNWNLFKACFAREWLLMKHNSFVYIFKTTQITIMATVTFTLFLRTEMKAGQREDGAKYFGALFFCLTNVKFNGLAELSMTVFRLPVFYKQRDSLFYPAWAFALPIWLLKIPLSLLESGIWILHTYYTIGFAPSASWFFRQLLAFFGIHQMGLTLFCFSAALGRTEVAANTFVPGDKKAVLVDDNSDNEQFTSNLKASSFMLMHLQMSTICTLAQGIEENQLQLLRDVSGAFRPGALTALVGVSGAGKTTLIDVLAGRKTGGYIEGSISISGYQKNQATFARIIGYCERNDIHLPYVTVYEYLLYSAWLRLATDMFVEEVMELVELNPVRNALVGLPRVDGLSTEQQKG